MEKTREKFKFRFLIWAAALILSVSGTAYSNVSIVQAEQTVYVTPTGSKYHAYKCGNGNLYAHHSVECAGQGLNALQQMFRKQLYAFAGTCTSAKPGSCTGTCTSAQAYENQ